MYSAWCAGEMSGRLGLKKRPQARTCGTYQLQRMFGIACRRPSFTTHHEVQTEPGRVDLVDSALFDQLLEAAVLRFEGGDMDDLWEMAVV